MTKIKSEVKLYIYILYVLQFDAQGNRALRVTKVQNNKKNGGMLFNAAINNISAISWRSVVLVEDAGDNP